MSDIVLLLASNSLPKSLTVPAFYSCLIVPSYTPALPVLLCEFSKVPDRTVPSWNSRFLSSLAMLLFRPALAAAFFSASNSSLAYYSFLSLSLSLAVNEAWSFFRIFSNF